MIVTESVEIMSLFRTVRNCQANRYKVIKAVIVTTVPNTVKVPQGSAATLN